MPKKLTKEEFIRRAKEIHGDKYDYSKVEYKNARTPLKIICPIHGEFYQTLDNHINKKCGCPFCANNVKMTTENFIKRSKEIHGNKYDYSKVNYINSNIKVCIIHPLYGEFWQLPQKHLNGQEIQQLKGEKISLKKLSSYIIFEEKANIIHNNFYIYHQDYQRSNKKIRITCPIHGDFWQTPNKHLIGQGCPKCRQSNLERKIENILYNNFEYISQCSKKDLIWLNKQSFDFYIPKYKVAIECQGIQHFKSIEYFGGEKGFEQIRERDERKRKLCEQHGIRLLYFSDLGIDYPYKVYEDTTELLTEILKEYDINKRNKTPI